MVVIFTTIILQLLNTSIINKPLSYHRNTFFASLYLQWITPSLVHYNWEHWLLNILNLILIIVIFKNIWTFKSLVLLFLSMSFFIVLCLYFFTTNIETYVGMSGILYGLATYGALLTFKTDKIISISILGFIFLKLFLDEKINTFLSINKFLNDFYIVTDVHFYGVIFAVIISIFHHSLESSKK